MTLANPDAQLGNPDSALADAPQAGTRLAKRHRCMNVTVPHGV
jgi:hypothetical protein